MTNACVAFQRVGIKSGAESINSARSRSAESSANVTGETYCTNAGSGWRFGRSFVFTRKTKKPIKLLIIEDETALLYALNARLSLKNYQVLTATDRERGYEIANTERPDILIIDTIINNISSLDLIEKIKLDKNIKNTPIILLSNTEKDINIKQLNRVGAKKVIIKTKHTIEELIEILDVMVKDIV